MEFTIQPKTFTVQRWHNKWLGSQNLSDRWNELAESVEADGDIIHVFNDANHFIYEVYAIWPDGYSEYGQGWSIYAFSVIHDQDADETAQDTL